MYVPIPSPGPTTRPSASTWPSRGIIPPPVPRVLRQPRGGARPRQPAWYPSIARALEALQRPSVVWIQLQECTGCVESVLRTAEPTIGNLVLDLVSLDYSHTLMAAAGTRRGAALQDAMKANAGKYLLVVTGSVPLEDDGIYTTIGGRTAKEILEEAAQGAAAVDRHRRLRPLGQRAGRPAQSHRRRRGVRR